MKLSESVSEFVIFCQKNSKYNGITFGSSQTISASGCLITSLATGVHPFIPEIDPFYVAEKCKFTKEGNLIWHSIEKMHPSLLFMWRYYNKKELYFNFRTDRNFIYFLEIDGIVNPLGSHWVTLVGFVPSSDRKLSIIADPYDGSIKCFETEKIKGGAVLFVELKKGNEFSNNILSNIFANEPAV